MVTRLSGETEVRSGGSGRRARGMKSLRSETVTEQGSEAAGSRRSADSFTTANRACVSWVIEKGRRHSLGTQSF